MKSRQGFKQTPGTHQAQPSVTQTCTPSKREQTQKSEGTQLNRAKTSTKALQNAKEKDKVEALSFFFENRRTNYQQVEARTEDAATTWVHKNEASEIHGAFAPQGEKGNERKRPRSDLRTNRWSARSTRTATQEANNHQSFQQLKHFRKTKRKSLKQS